MLKKLCMIMGLTIAAIQPLAHAEETKAMSERTETAIVAGGCFWCIESVLDETNGVISAVSGYTGGETKNPTYEQIGSGRTGHYEAVLVTYDPSVISYKEVLDAFWLEIDPLDDGGQFYDRGSQYKTAIFYENETQKQIAEASFEEKQAKVGKPLATEILPAATFYEAEEYHQDYYKKKPTHYNSYKKGSGREKKLKAIWNK